MKQDKQAVRKMVEAVVMFFVLAFSISTGWHTFLHYVPESPYVTPHRPYVSVSKGGSGPVMGSVGQDMERYLVEFWRFGG